MEIKSTTTSIESRVPGTERIFVKTWGCAHNQSDGEYMAGLLRSYGYSTSFDRADDAHLWLLNSCTVKGPAEAHLRTEIERAVASGKRVVVAGCVSQADPRASFLEGVSIVGVQQIDRVVEIVEETLRGNCVRLLGSRRVVANDGDDHQERRIRKAGGAPLELPKMRRNPLVEIIPISTGCLSACTYCKTRHARGRLGSYAPEEIVERARQALCEGVREIWLTSEDSGAYGRDIGSSLPELLRRLVAVLEPVDDVMLRLGMTNPPYILDHLDEIEEILASACVYSFLHVPVQSGSDSVLLDMRREYTRADFERVVTRLGDACTIATDLICGFPTESEEDFLDTLELVRRHRFPVLFINQFYPRPSTPAASIRPRVATQEVKRRTRAVTQLFNEYEPLRARIGECLSVLCVDVASDGRHLVGHSKRYEQVLLEPDRRLIGRRVQVCVTDAGKHFMRAQVIRIVDSTRALPDGVEEWLAKRLTNSTPTMKSASGSGWLRHWLGAWIALSLLAFAVSIARVGYAV